MLADIRESRKVPAKRGMRVTMDGKPGRITSGRGGYVMVLFDGERHPQPCHPWWRMTYHTTAGDVRVCFD